MKNSKLLLLIAFNSSLFITSCNYEVTVANLSSLWPSTWNFDNSTDYQYDSNYIEFANGKARLIPLGSQVESDFDNVNHYSTHINVSGHPSLSSEITEQETDVKTIFPAKTAHLIGYWRFDGNTLDSSGTNNTSVTETNVVINNIKKVGSQSAFFNGTDSVITTAKPTGAPANFTVAFWLNPTSCTQWSNSLSAVNLWGSFVFHTNNDCSVFVGTSSSTRLTPTIIPNNTIEINRWQMFVFTFDGTDGQLYKNGQLVAEKAMDPPAAWGGFNIGYPTDDTVDGQLDEVSLWSTSFTAAEILKLYNVQNSNFSELSSAWTPKWNNIIGYWKMDGNWQDSSNNNYYITPYNEATLTSTSKIGTGAGEFDSVNDYVSTTAIPPITNSLTISTWVYRRASSSTGIDGIISKGHGSDDATGSREPSIRIQGNRIVFSGRYGSSWYDLWSNYFLPLNRWTHIVVVRDQPNGLHSIYIDGELDNTLSAPNTAIIGISNSVSFSARYSIGSAFNNQRLNGFIDDTAIWNTNLSAAEVHQIYNRQKQMFAGHFDSEVIDIGGANSSWPDFSWTTHLPFGKELVGDLNNDGSPNSESSLHYSGLSGNLSNGLVGYWPFNEKTLNSTPGGFDFRDFSGQNNHGSEANGVLIGQPGKLGNAIKLDNTLNQTITIPTSGSLGFEGNSDFTASMWVELDTELVTGTSRQVFLNISLQTGYLMELQMMDASHATPGQIRAVQWDGTTPRNCNSLTNVSQKGVYHLLTRSSSTKLEVFLNGELFCSFNSPSLNFTGNFVDLITLGNGSNSMYDDLAIWNRELTDLEVQQLYRRGANRLKLQVKSCIDLACECESFSALPLAGPIDCDGDGILNNFDGDDIYKSKFIGPGGDGTTYYDENYNRLSSDVTFSCNSNAFDNRSSICIPDEITFSGGTTENSPEFLSSNFTQFIKPPVNRYIRYRVYMEADENLACSGKPCLPEISTVNLNPRGLASYYGEAQVIKPMTSVSYNTINSIAIEADSCVDFQLSPNDTDYYYWDTFSNSWLIATDNSIHKSSKQNIIDHITQYSTERGAGVLHIKAYLSTNSNRTTNCEISDISISSE